MIGVVDYRAGNAPSVMYALARLGIDARLVSDAEAVREVVLELTLQNEARGGQDD